MSSRRTLGAVLVACAALFTACGDDSDSGPAETSDRRPAEIMEADVQGDSSVRLTVEACNAEANRVTVRETESEVVITVTTDDMVLEDLCADVFAVQLDEPIGDRRLVNGTTGKAVSVSSS